MSSIFRSALLNPFNCNTQETESIYIFEAYLRNFYIYSGMFHKVVVTAEHRDSCSYLVGEVSCQIIVLPGEVLIIQLS